MNKIYLYIIAICILTFILGFLIGARSMAKWTINLMVKRVANNIAKVHELSKSDSIKLAWNILEGKFIIGGKEDIL